MGLICQRLSMFVLLFMSASQSWSDTDQTLPPHLNPTSLYMDLPQALPPPPSSAKSYKRGHEYCPARWYDGVHLLFRGQVGQRLNAKRATGAVPPPPRKANEREKRDLPRTGSPLEGWHCGSPGSPCAPSTDSRMHNCKMSSTNNERHLTERKGPASREYTNWSRLTMFVGKLDKCIFVVHKRRTESVYIIQTL